MSSSSADLQKESFMKSPDYKELACAFRLGCKVVVQYMFAGRYIRSMSLYLRRVQVVEIRALLA